MPCASLNCTNMRKIKIAFFADVLIRDFDGCLRTVFNIIDRIPKDRFDIEFFCGDNAPDDNIPFKVHRIPNVRIPMNKHYKMALPFLAKKKLDILLDNYKPDIIHITSPSPLGNYAKNYGKKNNLGVSTIYHTHFISYVDYYLRTIPALIPIARKTVVKASKNLYNQCDRIFIPTHEMIDDLSRYRIKTSNMILWPRGIDKNIFSPLKSDKNYLQNYTGNNKSNLLFASRLVWEKNLKTLIKIYKQIQKRKLPYNLIIAGDGVASEELKTKMPNAFFTGTLSQNELSKFYASADMFVFTSISETYGNVVIEAMASGLPCIIANGGGSKSFINHGENGFVCEPNNAKDYIKYIEMVQGDIELRQKFRINGFKFVRHLNWDSLVEKYFNELELLYQEKKSIGEQSPFIAA